MVIVLGLATGVRADPGSGNAAAVWSRFEAMLTTAPDDLTDAQFGFDLTEPRTAPVSADALTEDFDVGFEDAQRVVGFSANGEAAWIAADLTTFEVCGDETCPRKPRVAGRYHATALFAGRGAWQPVMWHVSYLFDTKEYAAAVKRGAPDRVDDRTGYTDDVVELFRSTIGDPAAMAKTVSPRADVVLYGTDRKERVVGGKKVAAALQKWGLALTVRDGLQAGTTASGTVAWIAANVDARPSKRPAAASTPYRVTVIYEQTRAGWKAVVVHFSYQR